MAAKRIKHERGTKTTYLWPDYRKDTTDADAIAEYDDRAECMGTAPHTSHQFNGGMHCPGFGDLADDTTT